jgi:hypothetical protein
MPVRARTTLSADAVDVAVARTPSVNATTVDVLTRNLLRIMRLSLDAERSVRYLSGKAGPMVAGRFIRVYRRPMVVGDVSFV